jgi:hypothetical protein
MPGGAGRLYYRWVSLPIWGTRYGLLTVGWAYGICIGLQRHSTKGRWGIIDSPTIIKKMLDVLQVDTIRNSNGENSCWIHSTKGRWGIIDSPTIIKKMLDVLQVDTIRNSNGDSYGEFVMDVTKDDDDNADFDECDSTEWNNIVCTTER